METAKRGLETSGIGTVVAGFFIPSTDMYVQRKLGDDAIALTHRNAMLRLATRDSKWMGVFGAGRVSGFGAGADILELAKTEFPNCQSRLHLWYMSVVEGVFADVLVQDIGRR